MSRWYADLFALTKPRVTRMCALTTAGGAWLAPGTQWFPFVCAVIGASLAVASASAFNMWWERDTDRFMARTQQRPLAAGRMAPATAFRFAWLLAVLSLVVLLIGTTLLTTVLAVLAIASYVAVYTPLKYKTPLALVIGAVPGAMPPLLGWTAITGHMDGGGLALFLILFVWQMPHFIAITLVRKQEFAAAGIRCVPLVRGDENAKLQAVLWALALVPISLLPTWMGLTGLFYGIIGGILSVGFFIWSCVGLRSRATVAWARSLFIASLVYLPAIVMAMAMDVFWQ